MDNYRGYRRLKYELVKTLGYSGKEAIPDALVSKIAEFIDAHPNDMMTDYYVRTLFDQFYRRRSGHRSARLFSTLSSQLRDKSSLIDIFFSYRGMGEDLADIKDYDIARIWTSLSAMADGYGKANCIKRFACFFTDDIVRMAYHTIRTMPDLYRIRALAGIYPRLDPSRRAETFAYLCEQFRGGTSEAGYQLKLVFPYLDNESRTELVSLHLDLPDACDGYLAYLVIRNAPYLADDDANRIVARVRKFQSAYLRNRCLLKLAAYLRDGELDELYMRFMEGFTTQEPSSQLIHNLYQFGAVVKKMDKRRVVDMALEKIAGLDDSQNDLFSQEKCAAMLFILPLLDDVHRARAYAIADTIRGGYRRTLLARMKVHFSHSQQFCKLRMAPICY